MCYIIKYEWLKNDSNLFVTCKYFRLSVDLTDSSDCCKYELMSVLAAIYSCFSSYYFTSCFKTCLTSSEKRPEIALVRLQISDVSFKS